MWSTDELQHACSFGGSAIVKAAYLSCCSWSYVLMIALLPMSTNAAIKGLDRDTEYNNCDISTNKSTKPDKVLKYHLQPPMHLFVAIVKWSYLTMIGACSHCGNMSSFPFSTGKQGRAQQGRAYEFSSSANGCAEFWCRQGIFACVRITKPRNALPKKASFFLQHMQEWTFKLDMKCRLAGLLIYPRPQPNALLEAFWHLP